MIWYIVLFNVLLSPIEFPISNSIPFKFQNFFQSEHQGFGLGHLQYPKAVKDPDEVPEAGHHGGEGSVAVFPPHHQVPARW